MLLMAGSACPMTPAALADTFGTGVNTFTIDFVPIGNPGNAADSTGYGAVPYNYQIGTYEVSRDTITKANGAGGLGIPLWDTFGSVPTHAATGMSWYNMAKFVNWLNTSQGYSPAYNFSEGNFALWSAGDAWTIGGQNLYRNKAAHYFLPSENEWYKAAYYDGSQYFKYTTGSNTSPIPVSGGTATATAVYNQDGGQGPADIFNAGGLSPSGTMGQGGNAYEWLEGEHDGVNDSIVGDRQQRGGDWSYRSGNGQPLSYRDDLESSFRDEFNDPTYGHISIGFRVAAVPEPEQYAAAFAVVLLGAGVWLRRRKV